MGPDILGLLMLCNKLLLELSAEDAVLERRKLEQQFVTKHEKPENVWTHEGQYGYREGEIYTAEWRG
jgi:hypothetical protein